MKEKNNSDYIYCSKCGKKNSIRDNFCTNCGNSLKSLEESVKNKADEFRETIRNSKTYKEFTDTSYQDTYISDFDNKDMINFIQKNVEYYIPKFKDIQELRQTTSWNWASFFFNSWWFLYRKMYGIGFGIIAFTFIVTSMAPAISTILNIGVSLLSGLFGNILYLKQVQKQLQSVEGMEVDLKQRILLNRGGVNLAIPVILAILALGVLLLIGALGAFLYMFTSSYYY